MFAAIESNVYEPHLFGVSDGKAVGTYFEQKFRTYLSTRYEFEQGNSAKGIDFPSIDIDVKVTRITQPQSSCPFKSARQKVYGLGYSLLVFVHDKVDDHALRAARLQMLHTVFVESSRTADYQTTSGILKRCCRVGRTASPSSDLGQPAVGHQHATVCLEQRQPAAQKQFPAKNWHRRNHRSE